MRNVIQYDEAFTEQYKILLEELKPMEIARYMEKSNACDTKSTSTYQRCDRVGKRLIRFKSVLGSNLELGKILVKEG